MEYIKSIFLYSKESPLLFTQFYFWAFFAVVLAIYTLIYKRKTGRSGYLFLISLFFYYKTSGFFFFILIFSTLADFYIGKYIYQSRSEVVKKWLVALSVAVNLGLLIYFKYTYFFTDNFNHIFHSNYEVVNYLAKFMNSATGTHFEVSQILLPVGISFFTFQTISYSIDVYKSKVKPVNNLIDFGFYVSFFPQLVAGPIVRAADFVPQLYKEFKLSRWEFGYAVFLILKGLIKKIFIGDYIAVNFVDRVFDNPLAYSGFENLMGIFGYSLQVYCDFSGYTDIAIGVALLMGFRLPKNFNSPYKATNVGEFWKRWHISLSSWLKDYLYIPMGGNKGGSMFSYIALTIVLLFFVLLSGIWWLILVFAALSAVSVVLAWRFPGFKNGINTNINLMITMLLGGLWHGASWQFVIWGGLNGVGLIIFKYWKRISPYQHKKSWPVQAWRIFLTFSFITFTRIWFRSESMEAANGLLYQIGHNFSFLLIPEMIVSYKYVFLMMLFGFVTHWLPTTWKDNYRDWFIFRPLYQKVIITAGVVFIIYQSISAEMQPFIYFQF